MKTKKRKYVKKTTKSNEKPRKLTIDEQIEQFAVILIGHLLKEFYEQNKISPKS